MAKATEHMRSYWGLLAIVGLSAMLGNRSRAQQISQADFLQYRDEEFRFSIHYPRSWARIEATHAQTRFKAVSDGGAGTDDLSVVVTTLPRSEEDFTPEEFLKSIDAQAYLKYVRQNVPGAELIEHGPTTLSNQSAYYFVIQLTHRALGIEMPMRQIQVQTARKRNVYTITFRTDPERFQRSLTLFEAITFGFVLWPEPPDVGIVGPPLHSPGADAPSAALAGGMRALLLIGLFALGAVILRFVVFRRALSKTLALGTVAPIWLVLLWFHHQGGLANTPSWLSAGPVVGFFLLISGRKSAKPNSQERDDSDGSGNPSVVS